MPRTIDLSHVDRHAFAADVEALHRELVAGLEIEDFRHLQRLERWGRAASLVGYGTAWLAFNPASAFLISLGIFFRWMVMHYVGHRGYDRVPGVPERYRSGTFARGWRRWIDWPEWMLPEAWKYEHNTLHHYRTGEEADPDLVERNAAFLRNPRLPRVVRAAVIAVFMGTWKFLYYAPNTIRELHRNLRRRAGVPEVRDDETEMRELFGDPLRPRGFIWRFFDPRTEVGRQLWTESLLPYALLRFGLIPALFLGIGPGAWLAVLLNSLLAEVLTNVHAFLVIVPNHSGDDVARFETPFADKAEFYLREVVGSVNFPGGSDGVDFLHGFLNYQIEHHVWPDLPMRKCREAQPKLEAICARHGVPYVSEHVLRRLVRLFAIMTGAASMPLATGLTGDAADEARRAAS